MARFDPVPYPLLRDTEHPDQIAERGGQGPQFDRRVMLLEDAVVWADASGLYLVRTDDPVREWSSIVRDHNGETNTTEVGDVLDASEHGDLIREFFGEVNRG